MSLSSHRMTRRFTSNSSLIGGICTFSCDFGTTQNQIRSRFIVSRENRNRNVEFFHRPKTNYGRPGKNNKKFIVEWFSIGIAHVPRNRNAWPVALLITLSVIQSFTLGIEWCATVSGITEPLVPVAIINLCLTLPSTRNERQVYLLIGLHRTNMMRLWRIVCFSIPANRLNLSIAGTLLNTWEKPKK